MADLKILAPFILSWEGNYANDPHDPGGPTKYGVTLGTWKHYGYDKNDDGKINAEDVKLLTVDDMVNRILKPRFWDRWRADEIESQSIANIVVDWLYNAGKPAITRVQRLLGVQADGIVGPLTIKALNDSDSKKLFQKIHDDREKFYRSLRNFPRYGKGWLNRNNAIRFGSLTYKGKTVTFNS